MKVTVSKCDVWVIWHSNSFNTNVLILHIYKYQANIQILQSGVVVSFKLNPQFLLLDQENTLLPAYLWMELEHAICISMIVLVTEIVTPPPFLPTGHSILNDKINRFPVKVWKKV